MNSQNISPIIFRYIGLRFLSSFGAIYAGLLMIIYLLDSIDVMRGLAKYNNFSLGRAIEVSALRLPQVGLDLMPFAILIAAVFTFWRLTRTSELVVVRATGVSVWQFLFAPFAIAVMLAFLKMMVLSPISSIMLAHYEELEAKYISFGSSVDIAKTGLWLRQNMQDGTLSILHADNVKMPEWSLRPVTAFFFDKGNGLTHRIDSERAELDHNRWVFTNAWVNMMNQTTLETTPQFYTQLVLPTAITVQDIERRFASPRVISFWHLPEYAKIMENTGFESNPLWAYFYSYLAEPFLNMALIFLAAALSLRSPRQQRGWWLVGGTLLVGFIVFFMGDFLKALGISERLPLVVAAFAPATITLLMGLTALLFMEEG